MLVDGFDSTENNANGIIAKGGLVGTLNANEVDIVLTNRFGTSVTTTDAATTTNLLTFAYPLEGVYTFEFKISAYNVTDQLAASYWIQIGRRSTGAAAFSYGIFDLYENEEGAMADAVVTFPASFATANQMGVSVNGLAGKTINWTLTGLYNFVGV